RREGPRTVWSGAPRRQGRASGDTAGRLADLVDRDVVRRTDDTDGRTRDDDDVLAVLDELLRAERLVDELDHRVRVRDLVDELRLDAPAEREDVADRRVRRERDERDRRAQARHATRRVTRLRERRKILDAHTLTDL